MSKNYRVNGQDIKIMHLVDELIKGLPGEMLLDVQPSIMHF